MAGSIEKRGKDTYRLVYFCGKKLAGSLAKHTKTVHCTKKEAKLELAHTTYSRYVAIPTFVISLLEEYKLWYKEQKSLYGELWINSKLLNMYIFHLL